MYRTTSTLFVRQGRKRGDIWPSALSGGYQQKVWLNFTWINKYLSFFTSGVQISFSFQEHL